jgi:hypothetical protein
MVAEHARADRPSPTTPLSGDAAALETIAELERRYRFREPEEVRAFLLAHPAVLDLVVQASAKIPEFLPVGDPLELHVVRDPEEDEDDGELFVIVPTRAEPEDIEPLLERFDRAWLIPAIRPVGLLFNVGIEYR